MKGELKKRLNGTSIFVALYAVLMMNLLFLQCIIPFLQNFLPQFVHYSTVLQGVVDVLNGNFNLPIDVMASFWIAIVSLYIGITKGSVVISKYTGKDCIPEMSSSDRNTKHLKEAMLLCFLLFAEAIILNILFDRELSLTQFGSAFGSAILLYVAGGSAEKGAKSLSKAEDLDQNGIKDADEKVEDVLGRLKEIAKANGKNENDLDEDGICDLEELPEDVFQQLQQQALDIKVDPPGLLKKAEDYRN